MEPKPVFILTGRRRPHHILLLAYSLVAGVAFLAGWVPEPRGMSARLNGTQLILWSLGLTVSGLVGLVGACWRGDAVRGLRLERSALLIGAGALFGYAWTMSALGKMAVFSVGFCIAWGIANLALATQIGQDLRNLGKVKNGRRAGVNGRGGPGRFNWRRGRGTDSRLPGPTQGQGRPDGHA